MIEFNKNNWKKFWNNNISTQYHDTIYQYFNTSLLADQLFWKIVLFNIFIVNVVCV
jgi:hypothetical protein